jgi:hypothetical protein
MTGVYHPACPHRTIRRSSVGRHAAASRRRLCAIGCASAAPPSFIGAGALPTAADGAAVNAGGRAALSPRGFPRRRAVAGRGRQGSGAGRRCWPRSPHAATPERGSPRRVVPLDDRHGRPQGPPLRVGNPVGAPLAGAHDHPQFGGRVIRRGSGEGLPPSPAQAGCTAMEPRGGTTTARSDGLPRPPARKGDPGGRPWRSSWAPAR